MENSLLYMQNLNLHCAENGAYSLAEQIDGSGETSGVPCRNRRGRKAKQNDWSNDPTT